MFFFRGKKLFFKIFDFNKRCKNEIVNNEQKIYSRFSFPDPQKIDFTTHGLQRDHSPAWELKIRWTDHIKMIEAVSTRLPGRVWNYSKTMPLVSVHYFDKPKENRGPVFWVICVNVENSGKMPKRLIEVCTKIKTFNEKNRLSGIVSSQHIKINEETLNKNRLRIRYQSMLLIGLSRLSLFYQ